MRFDFGRVFLLSALICSALSMSACTQKCGTCETIKKNDALVDGWINSIADSLDGATRNPGPPVTVTFPPAKKKSLLGKAAGLVGGVFSINGTSLAKDSISENIKCIPEEEVCLHCPPTPKIIFNCGQACEEDAIECEDHADLCFKDLLNAALGKGYSPRTNKYSKARVASAMKAERAQNAECDKVKGFHSKCEAAHSPSCAEHKTESDDPIDPGGADPTNGDATAVNQVDGQLSLADVIHLSVAE